MKKTVNATKLNIPKNTITMSPPISELKFHVLHNGYIIKINGNIQVTLTVVKNLIRW